MSIPWENLFNKFEELADELIEKVNPTPVTLYYAPENLTTITSVSGAGAGFSQPNIFDHLGGRVPLQTMDGRIDQQGNNLAAVPESETIKCRVYWVNRSMDPNTKAIGVKDEKHLCKVITYLDHNNKLRNASYALIDGFKCKMIVDPTPHGLGGRLYITSFWEVIG